jgi:membrane-associated protease RseP (regulator of RpoE activity)
MRRIVPMMVFALLASGAALAESEADAEADGHHFGFHVSAGGRLGVEAVQISKEVRHILGAPDESGVLVNGVKSDSVAAEAGIKPGDVIVEVAGQKVKDISSIRRTLADKEAGQTVPVVVIRDKRSVTLNAKLREKPKGRDVTSMMNSFELPGGEGFVVQRGELRRDFDRLSERLGDMEKRLQSLESRK